MITKLETITVSKTTSQRENEVTLFNCNCHSYLQVVEALVKAIKCDWTTAVRYAITANDFCSVAVYKGTKEDCEKVASILSSVGLNISVTDQ